MLFERHILKPAKKANQEKVQISHFGNITLENCLRSGQGKVIKIMSGRYPNEEHQSFEKLIASLLSLT